MREPKFWMPVWDLPTRLFGWAMAIVLPLAWAAWRAGRPDLLARAAEAALALLLFRLFWGFVGGQTARFAGFLRGPGAVAAYLAKLPRREPDIEIGHNPAGGWAALAMLLLLAAEDALALCRPGGPWAHLVPPAYRAGADRAEAWGFTAIAAMLGLYALAALFYAAVKRQDLLGPMLTGRRRLPGRLRAPRRRGPAYAPAALALAIALAWVLATRL